jgi:predicted DNA-binding transcriptional regulator AlpA
MAYKPYFPRPQYNLHEALAALNEQLKRGNPDSQELTQDDLFSQFGQADTAEVYDDELWSRITFGDSPYSISAAFRHLSEEIDMYSADSLIAFSYIEKADMVKAFTIFFQPPSAITKSAPPAPEEKKKKIKLPSLGEGGYVQREGMQQYLGIKKSTFHRYRKKPDFPKPFYPSKRMALYDVEEFLQWCKNNHKEIV